MLSFLLELIFVVLDQGELGLHAATEVSDCQVRLEKVWAYRLKLLPTSWDCDADAQTPKNWFRQYCVELPGAREGYLRELVELSHSLSFVVVQIGHFTVVSELQVCPVE